MEVTHIVCVDDERPVLDNIVSDIEDGVPSLERKYNVHLNIEACLSGIECLNFLEQCDKNGEDVAGIITDVRMPRMTGDQLLQKTTITHARAGISLITGYTDLDATVSVINSNGNNLIGYIKKPYDPQTLLKAVDATLDFFFRDRSPVIKMGGLSLRKLRPDTNWWNHSGWHMMFMSQN